MMLKMAASYGDGLNLAWSLWPEECRNLFNRLDEFALSAGRTSRPKRSVGLWTREFASESEVERAVTREASRRNISVDEMRHRLTTALWGTADEIAERLEAYTDAGVSHAILMMPHGQEIESMQAIREVL